LDASSEREECQRFDATDIRPLVQSLLNIMLFAVVSESLRW